MNGSLLVMVRSIFLNTSSLKKGMLACQVSSLQAVGIVASRPMLVMLLWPVLGYKTFREVDCYVSLLDVYC